MCHQIHSPVTGRYYSSFLSRACTHTHTTLHVGGLRRVSSEHQPESRYSGRERDGNQGKAAYTLCVSNIIPVCISCVCAYIDTVCDCTALISNLPCTASSPWPPR